MTEKELDEKAFKFMLQNAIFIIVEMLLACIPLIGWILICVLNIVYVIWLYKNRTILMYMLRVLWKCVCSCMRYN